MCIGKFIPPQLLNLGVFTVDGFTSVELDSGGMHETHAGVTANLETISCTLLGDTGKPRNPVSRWLEFLHLNTESDTEMQVDGMKNA
jgi:hypothetical protein